MRCPNRKRGGPFLPALGHREVPHSKALYRTLRERILVCGNLHHRLDDLRSRVKRKSITKEVHHSRPEQLTVNLVIHQLFRQPFRNRLYRA